ncbi:hypothetical protein EBE87_20270 [Pseudoroseomonas wenyumeiae]|uniref:Uncharacterized protein n=1 Tax=Teichococcus wenyumeiae TaxID=2478470 RepID=A0A3A9K0E1_9PROT|nr:hypothetical protein [Pseudoroseomonas wenyumeiae]RKK04819.1 hypothetical protein D6Z83_07545 [Pseudoroseomonas wenyumeiae]RMI19487.1 hypothetical protein EBE87_20270 [Pseudoroseomonas wenyumeiae]
MADAFAPTEARIAALERLIAERLPSTPAPDLQPEPAPIITEPEAAPVVVTPTPGTSARIEITSASGTLWPVELPEADDARLMLEVPAEIAGCTSLRLVVDHGRKQGVRWADVWLRNDISMREGGGPASYSVRVVLDGQEVLRRDVPRHHLYSGWGRMVSTGPLPETPWPDAKTLRAAGVASYAGSVDESVLQRYAAAMADPSWDSDVFATRGLYLDMPATGGRPDIGPATEAAAAAIISRDPRAIAYLIGQAEAAGGIPWHHWDASRCAWMRVTDWPGLWTDPRGGEPGSGTLLQPVPSAAEVGWELDSAHQPDCSFVAYLLTGRRAFLDNLQAQAAWNVVFQWSGMRGDSDMLVVWGNQVRGSAWALRQIDEAAWASPEGSVEKAYFTAVSEANWRWIMDNIPIWTEQQGEAHGWLPGEYGTPGGLSLWQQDYFASTAIAAAKRGNPLAKAFLEWAANFHLNRVAKLGHDGVGYILAVSDPETGETYRDWSRIKAETEKRGWSNGSGWEQSNGNYGAWFLSTLAGYVSLFNDAEARKLFKAIPTMGAPWTQPADFRRDPLLSIAPAE